MRIIPRHRHMFSLGRQVQLFPVFSSSLACICPSVFCQGLHTQSLLLTRLRYHDSFLWLRDNQPSDVLYAGNTGNGLPYRLSCPVRRQDAGSDECVLRRDVRANFTSTIWSVGSRDREYHKILQYNIQYLEVILKYLIITGSIHLKFGPLYFW